MGGGVIGRYKGLMHLLERRGGRGQGELIIIEAPLDVEMGLHEILITLALGTLLTFPIRVFGKYLCIFPADTP